MLRFTAVTRVLARWMLYTTVAAIALWLWGEGMFYLGHLVTPGPCCDGTWFSSSLHFMMMEAMALGTVLVGVVLWCLWGALKTLATKFAKAVAKERYGTIRR